MNMRGIVTLRLSCRAPTAQRAQICDDCGTSGRYFTMALVNPSEMDTWSVQACVSVPSRLRFLHLARGCLSVTVGVAGSRDVPVQVVLLLRLRRLWPFVDWIASLQAGLKDAVHQSHRLRRLRYGSVKNSLVVLARFVTVCSAHPHRIAAPQRR
jgi:hypothetical protein